MPWGRLDKYRLVDAHGLSSRKLHRRLHHFCLKKIFSDINVMKILKNDRNVETFLFAGLIAFV